MERIFVVCGAGASSTFLAHWMRVVAAQRSERVTITPTSEAEVDGLSAAGDVVLVGNHLEPRFEAIASASRGTGATAVLLPPLGFDAAGADVALTVARSARTRSPEQDHETPEHHREPENIHG